MSVRIGVAGHELPDRPVQQTREMAVDPAWLARVDQARAALLRTWLPASDEPDVRPARRRPGGAW